MQSLKNPLEIYFIDTKPDIESPLHEDFFVYHWIKSSFPEMQFTWKVHFAGLNKKFDLSLLASTNLVIIGGSPLSCVDDSPNSVHSRVFPIVQKCISSSVPILAICFGCQIIAKFFNRKNGVIKLASHPKSISNSEFGLKKIYPINHHPLFTGLGSSFINISMHSDCCVVPENWIIARSDVCPIQAFQPIQNKKPLAIIGIQFHPEMPVFAPKLPVDHIYREKLSSAMILYKHKEKCGTPVNHSVDPQVYASSVDQTNQRLLQNFFLLYVFK